eukprot:TRINITY_DN2046_c0_g1_i1.p1 TRINITY_DN2046_c0_g1~~TRINITY_DN2046_c0_g1_i1.p1  ORF type:complete len:285 (+),score=51.23 TRINITY_DN2046_c0_g1_i1:32-886(+)
MHRVIAGLALGASVSYAGAQRFQSTTAKEASQLSANEWRSFVLDQVRKLNHNVSVFRFNLPNNAPLGISVASCVLTKGPVDKDGKDVVRPYTPITGKDQRGYFELLVKHYEGGPMSSHIFNLKPGDKLDVKGPFVKLEYKPRMKRHLGMIAGGTGITPMYQLINEVLSNPEDNTEIDLIYCNRTVDDIVLRSELDQLARRHRNFRVHYSLDQPCWYWSGWRGFLTERVVSKHIPKPSNDSLVLVCGPKGFMDHVSGDKKSPRDQGDVSGILKKLGYEPHHVFKF